MAGDWIKMRGNLWDDPRVTAIVDATDSSEAAVIGALYWLWSTADQHTEDGVMHGLTLRAIDRKTGVAGFGQALCAIGWLEECGDGVCIVAFSEHNGESAKKRCQTAKRVANHKAANAQVTQAALPTEHHSVSTALPREREEKSNTPPNGGEARKRAARLPDDWQLPKAWGEWAMKEQPSWTTDHCRQIGMKFGNYWQAKSGKDATKLDWFKTWQNWVLTEGPMKGTTAGTQAAPIVSPAIEQTRALIASQALTPEQIEANKLRAAEIRQQLGNVLKVVA